MTTSLNSAPPAVRQRWLDKQEAALTTPQWLLVAANDLHVYYTIPLLPGVWAHRTNDDILEVHDIHLHGRFDVLRIASPERGLRIVPLDLLAQVKIPMAAVDLERTGKAILAAHHFTPHGDITMMIGSNVVDPPPSLAELEWLLQIARDLPAGATRRLTEVPLMPLLDTHFDMLCALMQESGLQLDGLNNDVFVLTRPVPN